jgi:hypothetical protein
MVLVGDAADRVIRENPRQVEEIGALPIREPLSKPEGRRITIYV